MLDVRAVPAVTRRRSGIPEEAAAANASELSGWAFFRSYAGHAAKCLAEEERGSVDLFAEGIPNQLTLLVPDGRWWPEEAEQVELVIKLDRLRPEFREALTRRQPADVVLGWVVRVLETRSGPLLAPIITIPARFNIKEDCLGITVDAVTPDLDLRWARELSHAERRRLEGWLGLIDEEGEEGATKPSLLDLQTLGHRLGLFLARRMVEQPDPLALSPGLRLPARVGCYNLLGLFLLDRTRYTSGAVADLRDIAGWADADLERTALASLFLPGQAITAGGSDELPVTEPVTLGEDQLAAVRAAMRCRLVVVTGPPGTGKSQTAAALMLNAALHGQSVLLASRNHKALDAVEERLSSLTEAPLLLRLSRPSGAPGDDMLATLDALLARPSASFERDRLLRAVEGADRLDARRRFLTQELETIARLGDAMAEKQAELDRLTDIIGEAAAVRLADQPRLPVNVVEPPARFEAWPLIGGWLARLRRRRVLARLRAVDWRLFGLPPPDERRFDDSLRLYRAVNQWQAARDELTQAERALRATRPRSQLLAELLTLSEGIRNAAQDIVRSLLPEVMGAVEDEAHERLSRLRDAIRLAEATGGAAKADRETWAEVGPDLLDHLPLFAVTNLSARRRIPLVPGLFDLLVLDEASQCDIPSALPLLARARRAVIVGDPMQLGHVARMNLPRELELLRHEGLERDGIGGWLVTKVSLFDLARRHADRRHLLRDHFRCHEAIADYVSRAFYGGRLNVLTPSNSLNPPPGQRPGVHWTDVRGAVEPAGRGCHAPAEADAIIDILRRLLIEQGWRGSVGVATPFREQAKRLSDRIAREIPGDVILAADLAAGTVHQFQGDARDLVLISLCLGEGTPRGSLEFLRREARLLNVAVSRARAVCHVVGDRTYARSCGIAHVEALVRAVSPAAGPAGGERGFQSPWERRLHDALVLQGLRPIPQYALAGRFLDLAVIERGHRIDVEVDGDAWHRNLDGKRRSEDLWRDHQIKSLGWEVERFWVYELRDNLDGCVQRILTRLE